jgi:hypothetical protein
MPEDTGDDGWQRGRLAADAGHEPALPNSPRMASCGVGAIANGKMLKGRRGNDARCSACAPSSGASGAPQKNSAGRATGATGGAAQGLLIFTPMKIELIDTLFDSLTPESTI